MLNPGTIFSVVLQMIAGLPVICAAVSGSNLSDQESTLAQAEVSAARCRCCRCGPPWQPASCI